MGRDRDASETGSPKGWRRGRTPRDLPLSLAPLLCFGAVGVLARWPAPFRVVVAEDGILEWLQVAAFVVAASTLGAFARAWRWASRSVALIAAACALLFLVVVGEELAWGQRHLGVTVAAVESINDQGDLTVHNVGGALRVSQAGNLLVAAVAALLALRCRRPGAPGRIGLPSGATTPRWLFWWFASAAAYIGARLVLSPVPSYEVAKLSEVAELFVASGCAVTGTVLLVAALEVRGPARPQLRTSGL